MLFFFFLNLYWFMKYHVKTSTRAMEDDVYRMGRDMYPSIPSRGTATQSKSVKPRQLDLLPKQAGQEAEQAELAVAAGRNSERLGIAAGRLRERTWEWEGAGERMH